MLGRPKNRRKAQQAGWRLPRINWGALGIALDPLPRGEQAKAQAEPPVAPVATTETTAAGRLSRDEPPDGA